MITLKKVCKSFGEKVVLKNVDLCVRKGETLTIIGGSGSGKSVLIKHMIGLIKPDSGSVLVGQVDITPLSGKRLFQAIQPFAMVFQNGALFDSLTVGENVAFAIPEKKSKTTIEIQAIVESCLDQVGLSGISSLMPSELSGGMKKRVAIARAMAKKPRIVLYDEPTTGLDPIMSDVINQLIVQVSESDPDITSVVITHDLISAYRVSHRIAMLYNGDIVAMGTPEEIRKTDHPVLRQFIDGRSQGPIKWG